MGVRTKQLVQRLAQFLPPQAVSGLKAQQQLQPARSATTSDLAGDDDTSVYDLVVVAFCRASHEDGLKLRLFVHWKVLAANRKRLRRLLERGVQLRDDRRMRDALSQWSAVAFESRLSAVLLSRGLALCAVLLASAREAYAADRTAVSTRTVSFATSVLAYGAALHHVQTRALEVTGSRPSVTRRRPRTLPGVPGLGSTHAAVDTVSADEYRLLKEQIAAAQTAVRERDAWLHDLQAERSAAAEVSRQATTRMQSQSEELDYWRGEASRWMEARDAARKELVDSQALLQDSCVALEHLQISEQAHTQRLVRAHAECEQVTKQLRVAEEASREESARVAQLTAERDALRESVVASRAAAEIQLSLSEAGRSQAEEACRALQRALDGAESRLSAVLTSASIENADLLAQLRDVEARAAAAEQRLHDLEAGVTSPRVSDPIAFMPASLATPASPLVLSRVLVRMAAVRAQLQQHNEPPLQLEATPAEAQPPQDVGSHADAARVPHGADAGFQSEVERSLQAALEARSAQLGSASQAVVVGSHNHGSALQAQLDDALRRVAVLEAQLADSSAQMMALQTGRDAAAADALRATAELARARMEVRLTKSAAAGTISQKIQRAHSAASAQTEDVQADELSQLRAALEGAEAQGGALRLENDRLNAERAQLDVELQHCSAQVERASRNYDARMAETNARAQGLEQDMQRAQRRVDDLQAECDALRAQLTRRQQMEPAATVAGALELPAPAEPIAEDGRIADLEAELVAVRQLLHDRNVALATQRIVAAAVLSCAMSEDEHFARTLPLQAEAPHATLMTPQLRSDSSRDISDIQLETASTQCDMVQEMHPHTSIDTTLALVNALRMQLDQQAAEAAAAREAMEQSLAEARAQADAARADALARQATELRNDAAAHETAALAEQQARMHARAMEVVHGLLARYAHRLQPLVDDGTNDQPAQIMDALTSTAQATEPEDGNLHKVPVPQASREGVMWVRQPAAGAAAQQTSSHGPPQWIWVRHVATLWSNGVLKLQAEPSPGSLSGQENMPLTAVDSSTGPLEVNLVACGEVVMAAMDNYRHTSLRTGKRSCFHVLRLGGDLALAAACGNDAETRDWADVLRLLVQPRIV